MAVDGISLYRPLKKAHLLRCAQSPRSNVLLKYASARRFLARLAPGTFLAGLGNGFLNARFLFDHYFLTCSEPLGYALEDSNRPSEEKESGRKTLSLASPDGEKGGAAL